MVRRLGALLFVTSVTSATSGCASTTASVTPDTTEHVFTVAFDTPIVGAEEYVCVALPIDAEALLEPIVALRWEVPDGAVTLHHATLYATYPTADAPNAVAAPRGAACEAMSEARSIAHTLDVWVPGKEPSLGVGTALAVPVATSGLVVQAHLLRTRAGDSGVARLHLTTTRRAPSHLVAWTGFGAPVPALRPHMADAASASCFVRRPVHVVAAWPHMHRIGVAIALEVVRAGVSTPLVAVSPWTFDRQPIHPLDADLAIGDTLTLRCSWDNTGDAYVLPGPRSTDEMCTAGLVAWPAPADWLECP